MVESLGYLIIKEIYQNTEFKFLSQSKVAIS